jgi:hypothetical protein
MGLWTLHFPTLKMGKRACIFLWFCVIIAKGGGNALQFVHAAGRIIKAHARLRLRSSLHALLGTEFLAHMIASS